MDLINNQNNKERDVPHYDGTLAAMSGPHVLTVEKEDLRLELPLHQRH
jgi:hypothetical protein